jgi:feruloyl esterase
VNQVNPDLKAFQDHGGKLLQFHGWSDPAISPLNTVNYFSSVRARMGDTASFYRLFMMPGVGHCGGGAGPSEFDRMAVISDWVENGKAPDRIVASHLTGGKVDRTRPLCVYPKIAKYQGTGSTDDAASFACALP